MKMPGFTAEASLDKNRTSYRMTATGDHNDSSVVAPQMSCWRLCYDISSTNHELSTCYKTCSRLKDIFGL
jgi:hypothetical protein